MNFFKLGAQFAGILLCTGSVFASTDGALILERANRNENIYSGGELVSHLRGNVVFRYEDIRISSDEATWWRNKDRVHFRRKVKVERGGDIITCDRLNFEREKNLLTARGSFFYRDSAEVTSLRGNEADYAVDKKTFIVRGNPRLVRKDSTDTDTLFISGRVMAYDDSLKIATVTDSVRIARGSLVAFCQKAEYFANTNMAHLRISPEIFYDTHRVTGDSIDLQFGGESLESARVVGSSHGRYTDASASSGNTSVTYIWSDSLFMTMSDSGQLDAMRAFGRVRGQHAAASPSSSDTSVTHIWSDSLLLTMSDSGRVDAIRAYGKVHGRYAEVSSTSKDTSITHIWSDSLFVATSDVGRLDSMQAFGRVISRYFAQGDSLRANEVSGRTMTLRFGENGKVEKAFIRGNAKSIYYIGESDGGGRNEASGEQIIVTFALGRARLLHLRGNARGIYFPNTN